MLIACVGGESSWLFFFKELVQSLEQRQSLLLKQTHDLHIRLVSTVLHQAIFLEPKLPTQYSLDSRAEKDNCSKHLSNKSPILNQGTSLSYFYLLVYLEDLEGLLK